MLRRTNSQGSITKNSKKNGPGLTKEKVRLIFILQKDFSSIIKSIV